MLKSTLIRHGVKTDPATPAAPAPAPSNDLTAEQVQALVTKAVTDAQAKNPAITADQIKAIVAEAVKANTPAPVAPVAAPVVDTKAIVAEAVKAAFDDHRKESKMAFQVAAPVVETPTSWCKGNLPLHGKQLLNVMRGKSMNDGISEAQAQAGEVKGDEILARYQRKSAEAAMGSGEGYLACRKSLTSTGNGTGDQLVPTNLSSELQRLFYMATDLAAIFAGREIQMPTNPFELPMRTAINTYYLESTENTSATASDLTTTKPILTAVKLMGSQKYSYEVDEDSIIAILPMIQESLALGAARSWEDALINGDTTATHMDSDYETVAKHAARAVKGFRRLCIGVAGINASFASGDVSAANLASLQKAMKKFGLNPKALVWVVGPSAWNQMSELDRVQTLEKYGPSAVVQSGELRQYKGIPIVTSEFSRENLNASGVYDGSTTTKGAMLLVRPDQFLTGRRRDFTVEVDRNVESQENVIVASFRKAFTPLVTPSATHPSVACGFNWAA